ncbi:MAG: SRPBCC family protein [Planctomycetota bacterium]|nr:SRPBCC family protein [Planctomycetota bacterium]
MTSFVARVSVAAPRPALYAWHARPGAFERLTPPGPRVRLVEDSGGIGDGARKVLAIGPVGLRWVAVHDMHHEGHRFRDVQERGPFRRWEHTHTFLDDGAAGSVLEDAVEYELPLGRFGELVAGWAIRRKLLAMFAHRHRVTRHDVELAAREPAGGRRLRIDRQDCDAGRVTSVWAFLSALGWPASAATGHSAHDPSATRVCVHPDRAEIEGEGRREIVPLLHLDDASLTRLHQSLRRFEAAAL